MEDGGSAGSAGDGAGGKQEDTQTALKDMGNSEFNAGRLTAALDYYTRALGAGPATAALYSNRAACHLKLEMYGAALGDADKAIELDPTFNKGYYRRGCVHMAQQNLLLAQREFLRLHKADPKNKDVAKQLEAVNQMIKAKRDSFFSGGEEDSSGGGGEPGSPAAPEYDPARAVSVPEGYRGAVLPRVPEPGAAASAEQCAADPEAVNVHGLSLAFVRKMKEDFKSQRLVAKRYAQELLVRLRTLLVSYSSLIRASFPESTPHFNVCGDTHGQFYDTCNIFDAVAGEPSPTNPCACSGGCEARRPLCPPFPAAPSPPRAPILTPHTYTHTHHTHTHHPLHPLPARHAPTPPPYQTSSMATFATVVPGA